MSCRPLAAAADFASSAAAASIAWLTSSAQACTDSLNTAPCFATNFLSCGEYMAPQTTSSTLVERLWMCISTGSSDDESLLTSWGDPTLKRRSAASCRRARAGRRGAAADSAAQTCQNLVLSLSVHHSTRVAARLRALTQNPTPALCRKSRRLFCALSSLEASRRPSSKSILPSCGRGSSP